MMDRVTFALTLESRKNDISPPGIYHGWDKWYFGPMSCEFDPPTNPGQHTPPRDATVLMIRFELSAIGPWGLRDLDL